MLMVFDVRRTIDQGGRTTAERSVGGPSGWGGGTPALISAWSAEPEGPV